MKKVFEVILLTVLVLCIFTGCPAPESPANPAEDIDETDNGGTPETPVIDDNVYTVSEITTEKFFEVCTQLINDKKFTNSHDAGTYSFGTWILNKDDFAAKNPTLSADEVNRAYAHLGLSLRLNHHEYEQYEMSDMQNHPHDEYDLYLIQNNSSIYPDQYLFSNLLFRSYKDFTYNDNVTMGESQFQWRQNTVDYCPENCNEKFVCFLEHNIMDIRNIEVIGTLEMFLDSLNNNYNETFFSYDYTYCRSSGYKKNGNNIDSCGYSTEIYCASNEYSRNYFEIGTVSKDMITMKLWELPDMRISTYATETREQILAKMGYPYELLDRVNYECYYKYDFVPGVFPSF